MPAIFVSHGSPMVASKEKSEEKKRDELRQWAKNLPEPAAILVISAHWFEEKLLIGAPESPALLYDYYGFPDELYRLKYPAPHAREIEREVHRALAGEFTFQTINRRWDHGVFIPLLCMYPKAEIPVLQMSLPQMEPAEYANLGRRLSVLREKGVLIMGSGAMTHNLRKIDFSDTSEPEPWAMQFDAWVSEKLEAHDSESMIHFRQEAPSLALNHPTVEHFLPLLIAMGAGQNDAVSFPVQGFEFGNLSRRCVQFG